MGSQWKGSSILIFVSSQATNTYFKCIKVLISCEDWTVCCVLSNHLSSLWSHSDWTQLDRSGSVGLCQSWQPSWCCPRYSGAVEDKVAVMLRKFAVLTVSDLSGFSVAPKILEAMQIAETYMDKTENFGGKVTEYIYFEWRCFRIQFYMCHIHKLFLFNSRVTSFKRVRRNQA